MNKKRKGKYIPETPLKSDDFDSKAPAVMRQILTEECTFFPNE